MEEKLLTYRYPRTLAEACARYACDGKDAVAVHGPYKTAMNPDDVVTAFCLAMFAVLAVFALLGWLK